MQAEKDAEPPLIFSEKYGISLGLTAPAAHPERLLHSEKLKKLLLAARADERFDYVLLDSPPMLLSADSEALSALSDLSVLVVRQDYTPAGILNDCADALTESGADFAGFIIYNEEGVEVFNFGKNKGVPVVKVLKEQPGYFAWMLNGEFPLYTKKILTEIRLRTAGLVK